MNPTALQRLWRFIREEDSAKVFEGWFYKEYDGAEIDAALGSVLVGRALEADYNEPEQVDALRRDFREYLTAKGPCPCATWADDQRLTIGSNSVTGKSESVRDFLGAFLIRKRQSPWLYAVECRVCGTSWYLAVDTVHDVYLLHRLGAEEPTGIAKGRWPHVFDGISAVWPSQEWLALHKFASLEHWQRENENMALHEM